MRIFFSVGEPSGDLHGANLIRELQRRAPDAECVGFGGPKMRAAGCELLHDLTQLAVMWVADVIKNYFHFRRLLQQAEEYLKQERPDVVVLIDYPGFNWCIAKRAKKLGIPVVYYGTPQLWAWAPWRIRKMRRTVDHALCKLPFEEAWFRSRGVNATYVGHPYFDELRAREIDQPFVENLQGSGPPIVTLLPGSRDSEVRNNLPSLLKTAEIIARQVPGTKFLVAAYKSEQAELARGMAPAALDVDIHAAKTPELIEAATCCLACSGSVSLELLYHRKPAAILYRVSRFGYFIQSIFRRVRYITLVNLLTAEDPSTGFPASRYEPGNPRDKQVVMPEYLTCGDRTQQLASHAVSWLTDESNRARTVEQLKSLKEALCDGGASVRAADYILKALPHVDREPGHQAA